MGGKKNKSVMFGCFLYQVKNPSVNRNLPHMGKAGIFMISA